MATITDTRGHAASTTPVLEKKAEQKKQLVSPGISLIAGAMGGATEAIVTYPFEFAKTRSQLSKSISGAAVQAASKNPFAVIIETARNDGFRAIYTGCSTLVVGTAFKAGVRFLSFDSIKNAMAGPDGKLTAGQGIIAGMAAGALESLIAVTPTERIKTALIDDARRPTRQYNGAFHALRTIVTQRGITELYRGLLSTTLKQSATSAVRMGSYSALKEAVATHSPKNAKNPVVTFGLGSVAGIITVYATQPFDTIKTRAQGAKGATMVEAVRAIISDGGVRGFWSGSTMRLGRLVLSGGIVFTVYENMVTLLSGIKK